MTMNYLVESYSQVFLLCEANKLQIVFGLFFLHRLCLSLPLAQIQYVCRQLDISDKQFIQHFLFLCKEQLSGLKSCFNYL